MYGVTQTPLSFLEEARYERFVEDTRYDNYVIMLYV